MQDNDLSAAPTRRMWVVADTILIVTESEVEERKWLKTTTKTVRNVAPDLGTLSRLWRWSANIGVRMELVFVDTRGVTGIWDMLERGSANPFSDWHNMDARMEIAEVIAYRPDIVGVIDLPEFVAIYGGRGMPIQVIR